ncbi:hypothetical protein B0H16DRAFT_1719371 [Mycena metata]|uniref:Uncharacterized protein n=1 Tax=Mycena metata TaxID=1033252 RepID=A0AAD7NIR9_9AGAR|nr:hypothetical protein B0H16DRAFT_1719371 [Mycena metata]
MWMATSPSSSGDIQTPPLPPAPTDAFPRRDFWRPLRWPAIWGTEFSTPILSPWRVHARGHPTFVLQQLLGSLVHPALVIASFAELFVARQLLCITK